MYNVNNGCSNYVVYPGAKLEGGGGGGGGGGWGCDTPLKYESSGLTGRIIWIGRAIKDFK
jgi:hypothetical protein